MQSQETDSIVDTALPTNLVFQTEGTLILDDYTAESRRLLHRVQFQRTSRR